MRLRTRLGLPEGVPGIVMAIDSFGDYLDFHSHLNALVADTLFARSGGLPQPSGRQLFRVVYAPRHAKKPVFDFLAHFLSLCGRGNET